MVISSRLIFYQADILVFSKARGQEMTELPGMPAWLHYFAHIYRADSVKEIAGDVMLIAPQIVPCCSSIDNLQS